MKAQKKQKPARNRRTKPRKPQHQDGMPSPLHHHQPGWAVRALPFSAWVR